MAEEVIEAGQLETGSGTPPDTGATGEASPTSQGASEEATPTSTEDPAPKEKAKPYDQDETWLNARKAEKWSDDLGKKHDMDREDIEDALEEIGQLRKDLDGKDLKQLVKDQKELQKLLVKMDKDKQKARDEDETLDERAERLERENEDLRGVRAKEKAEKENAEASERAIQSFNTEVSKVLDNEEVPKEHMEALKNFLGVDNPLDEVDPGNKREVRRRAKEGVKKFNDFLETVQQKAIDDYAAGKGKVTPISKAKVVTKEAEKKEAPKGKTSAEYFDAKRKELSEAYRRSAEAT